MGPHQHIEAKAAFRRTALRTALFAIASAFLAGSARGQVISNVAATNVSNTSAVVTWTTDQPSSSLVNYGVTTSYGSSSVLNSGLTTSHSVTLSGLAANTLYDFDVVSTNSVNSTRTSANARFATLALAPIFANINVIYVTSNSATINWSTDQPSTSLVNYGTTTAYGSASSLNSTQVIAHTVTLNGLAANTTYDFDVVSMGVANVNSSSANQTFTTAAASATAPNVGFVASYGFTNSSAILTWSTDVASNTVLAYGTTPALGQLTPVQTAQSATHEVILTGLSPGTTYYFIGESTGTGGATGYSTTFSLATTGPPSLVPIISNVTAVNLTSTSATITWTTNAPSTSKVNYGTTTSYGSSSPLDPTLTTNHSVTLTGLTANTAYDYQLDSASTTGEALFGANMTGKTVWAWGDSLTLGYGDLTQNTYPLYLTTLIGTPVANEAVGGTISTQIAAAMLGTPAALTPGNCNLIWSGGNNHDDVSTVLSDIASMVNGLQSPSCYLVLGDINPELDPLGSTDYNDILSTNQSLATQYGNNYLNIRELMVQDYNPALPLDQWTYANDIPADSLHAVRAQGTITSGALSNVSCAIGVSGGTNGVGTVIIIDSESILVNAMSDSLTVSACTRGYNATAAASHLANASYSLVDSTHLGSNGYQFAAQQVAAWFDKQFPLNFTTPAASLGPAISGVTASSITSTSAVITWTTDQPSTSLVNYGTTAGYGKSSVLNQSLTTSHSVTLTGLAPTTTYDFDVASANASAATSTSGNATFATTAQATTPPVISNVTATNITSSSVTVTWTTDQPSSSLVNYGTTTAYGSSPGLNSTLVATHSATLTGLSGNTLYEFDVVSGAATGTTTSAAFAFATMSSSPIIGSINVTYLTSSSATINWTTDQPSTGMVNYGTTTGYGSTSALNSTLSIAHSITLNGLAPGTTYNFDVVSVANASSTSANQTFATAPASATAPNLSFVASYGYTNTGATISWSTDVAANTLLAYGTTTALGQFSPIQAGLSASHGVTLTGLSPGTTYYFVASSTGANGATGYSTTYSFTTMGTASLVPIISNVASSNLAPTSATITWTTNVPSTSVVNYGTTISYGLSALNSSLTTAHSVTLTGLAAGTTYDFQVASASTAGMSSFGASLSGFTIWAWGDSQTVGGKDGSRINYPNTLTNELGVPVINEGEGGDTSTQIAQRMLATPASFGAGNCNVFWAGSNNPTQVSQIVADDASMVNALVLPACYLVLGDVNWVSTPLGSSTYNDIVATSADLVAAYPNNYLNIRELVVQDYNPSLPLDVADHANDVMPSSLRAVVATGTITSGALDSASCTFSVSSGTQGPGTVVIIDSETILINAIPDNFNVTSCARGYNGTAATSHAANATYSVIDPIHLGYNGLEFVAGQVANWFQSQTWPLCAGTGLICPFPASFTTPGTAVAGPVISAVTVSGITTTSATITWTTDQASSSQVNFGTTTGYGLSSTLNPTLVTSHSVTLTGLTPGTAYDFDVVSANSSAVSTASNNAAFATTSQASTPPVISSVATTGVSQTTVTVTWTTDQPATSQVNYGTTTGYGSVSTLNATLATAHSVTLTGLTAGTTYDFDVVSANAASQSTTSSNATVTTTAANATPPYVGYVAAWGINNSNATVTWSTDVLANTQLAYGTTTALGQLSPLQTAMTASHGVTLSGLISGTTYYFVAQSTAANGATGYSAVMTFTTTGTAPVVPPVISNVLVSGITSTSVTITWTTDQTSSSLVNYGTTTGYGSASTLSSTLVTSHTVTLTGLTAGTTYDFDVVSANAGAISATSGNATFVTTSVTSSPPVISNVVVGSITNTTATITWTTDQASSSLVNYGTTIGYGSASALNPSLVTSHSVTLTGLTAGTTYDFDVVSANVGAMSSTSGNSTFITTSVSTSAPVISNVATTNVSQTSVTVTWTTDQASSSLVNYGTTTGYGSSSGLNATLVTAHSVTLTGLTAGTTYDLDVTSTNATSQSATSPNAVVTTTAANATPPYVGYVAAWGINNTGVTVTWSTDVLANAQLAYGTTNALGQLSPLQTAMTASHGVTLTGLNPGTTYYFVAQSTAANGATGYSSAMSFTTTGTQTTPPPVISNVTAGNITGTTATITWTTDQATSSQVNYGLSTTYTLSSTLSQTLVTSHSVTLTGLNAGATYDFDVASTDSSAISSTSTNYTFSTTGSAPPPAITNVNSSSVTSGTATIAWTTDQASSSVVNYGTTTGYGSTASLGALVTSHLVTLTGLAPNTTYNFDVVSANAANASSASANYTFKTTANTAPPPVIAYLNYWGVTATGVTIAWSTDALANTAVAYGTTNALGQLSPVQTALTNSHGVTLTGLNSGTTYYFVAQSADGSGNTGYSTTYSFTTLAGPPSISGVSVAAAANNKATVSWTTSVPTTSYVQYGATTNYGFYSSWTSLTATPSCPLSYVPSGTVHYQVFSTDANGNQTASPDMTFVEP